ncbi:uncharacterized protein BJX67DRAFT_340169 [Aspergillus lucknowensis]|uniref:Uncharacterized protein n=1 Tax=Aspergillus lucknowensis TaxID=176173 RepID=A0ABR4M7W5_9EURO
MLLPTAFTMLLLTLLTTSSPASSTPTNAMPKSAVRLATDPSNPALTWYVSSFETGCSPGGCVYSFNIAGVASANTPGFNTTCNGTSVEKDYVECKDKGVLSQLVPAQYPNWTVKAQHRWRKGEWEQYYAYGEKNVTAEAENFTIRVGEVYGVA